MGIGVFSENKLNLFLKDDEALGFMILKGVPKFGAYNLDIPEFDKITGTIDKSNVSTKIDLKNKKIYFRKGVNKNEEIHKTISIMRSSSGSYSCSCNFSYGS